ncbi:MAG: ankyrin repeat domain-containing protein [Cyclobacteriaceae bacterium]
MSYKRSIQSHFTTSFFKKEAKKLLKQYRDNNHLATELFDSFHPEKIPLQEVKLADAQLVIARHYGQKTWGHLLKTVRTNEQFRILEKAFQSKDKKGIGLLLNKYHVLFERLLLRTAVLYGDIEMVKYIYDLGARDIQDALGQAIYTCSKEITDFLISKGGDMEGKDRYGLLGSSSCELLNLKSLKYTLSYRSMPVPKSVLSEYFMVLVGTYMRNPKGKHECIEELVQHGLELVDTPILAFHRGRIDLLTRHLKHDPDLVNRRFSLNEIFGSPFFRDKSDGLHLCPLEGTTLLHLAMEYDEREIMQWLVQNGADTNVTSTIDEDGFGGHTPLYHCTVNFVPEDSSKAAFLLEHGANPNHRCSLRKQLKYTGKRHMEDVSEYKDVTPISFAEQWHFQGDRVRSAKTIELLKEAGGVD